MDLCLWCDRDVHHCTGCGGPLSHAECNGAWSGCCDECHDLLAREGI